MKILIVSQFYYPERFSVNEIAEGLLSLGHEVEVITGQPNYGFGKKLPEYKGIKEEVINGVKVHRCHLIARKNNHFSVSINYLSFYFSSRRFVRHFKKDFDIVLSFSLSPVISISAANIYAKKHNIPHVLFCMDLWPESTVVTGAVRMNSLIYKILYKWSVSLYSKVDKIIVSSPSFIDYFKNVLHIEKPFVHINQPILRSRETLPGVVYEKKHNIVYAGNIGKIQLIHELVSAMKLVDRDDVMLHLTAMGSESENIVNRIKEERLEDRVIYHGPLRIEDVETYFRNADALLVSLKSEGTVGKTIPNKAIQYLSYGKPILGVIQGDGKDLLTKAGGCLFSDETPENIALKINEIISLDEKEKTQMGLRNKEYFDNNLSFEKIVHLVEASLTDVKK